MDESSRIASLRNRTLYTFSQSTPKKYKDSDTIINERVGGIEELAPAPPTVPEPLPLSNCIPCILSCLESVLSYAATTNMGPTKSSRFYYLFLASVAQGYNWVQDSHRISGTLDTWNWDQRYLLSDHTRILVWINRVLITIMPSFVPTYDSVSLLAMERSILGIDVSTQTFLQESAYFMANQGAWFSAWTAWWGRRTADGSATAATLQPTVAQVPNMATFLEVAGTVNPSTFPSPYQWTPLKLGTTIQKYATYTWSNVTSTALTPSDMSTIQAAATPFYAGSNTSARQAEISTIVGYTATLTDEEKINAEFWAGGPYTVSPPGMFIWFWKTLMDTQPPALDVFVFSGLDLAIHLFETGRVVWGLKQTYMEARPIQEIRRLYYGQTLIGYDGTPVLGQSWTPYQVPSFVTPPFSDFTSGHSGFSQSFANVMSAWFGSTIPRTSNLSLTDLSLLSPMFQSPQSNPFGQFTIMSGTSEVQPTIVPATNISFGWTTWQELALSAGLSRQYGGIHAISAHYGSVAATNTLHPILKSYWNLSPA